MHKNVYNTVAFTLHPKVKALLDELNVEGQIDHDSAGLPYVLEVHTEGGTISIKILRNYKPETILLAPRKKAEPIMTFKRDDGFKRLDRGKSFTPSDPSKERAKRVTESFFRKIVDSIMRDSH